MKGNCNYYFVCACVIFLLFLLIKYFIDNNVESFISTLNDSFCKTNTGNTLNEKCKQLTMNNCNQTDCCVYTKNNECVAGNSRDGPLFTPLNN